jgi:hypothetical protein
MLPIVTIYDMHTDMHIGVQSSVYCLLYTQVCTYSVYRVFEEDSTWMLEISTYFWWNKFPRIFYTSRYQS